MTEHQRNLAIERLQAAAFLAAAAALAAGLAFVLWMLVRDAAALVSHQNLIAMLLGTRWDPLSGRYGMAPFIWGSAVTAAIALAIAVPFGLSIAVWSVQILSTRERSRVATLLTVFASIPSVVYGWWGLTVVVPGLRHLTGLYGYSLLAGGVVLAVMILPTFALLAVGALDAIPTELTEASLGLGATLDQTLFRVTLPVASLRLRRAGAVALARALGETIAVQMVVGGAISTFPHLELPGATMTSQLLTDLPLMPPGTLGHGALALMALLLFLGTTLLMRFAAMGEDAR